MPCPAPSRRYNRDRSARGSRRRGRRNQPRRRRGVCPPNRARRRRAKTAGPRRSGTRSFAQAAAARPSRRGDGAHDHDLFPGEPSGRRPHQNTLMSSIAVAGCAPPASDTCNGTLSVDGMAIHTPSIFERTHPRDHSTGRNQHRCSGVRTSHPRADVSARCTGDDCPYQAEILPGSRKQRK